MGWGVGAALGQALSRMGNTWGSERIDLRRQLEDDQRRSASHALAMDTGRQNLAEGELGMQVTREQLEQARRINPMAVQKMEQDLQTGALQHDQAKLTLDEITKKVAAQDAIPNFHGRMAGSAVADAELRPKATQANIDQSAQGIRASQAQIANSAGQLDLARQANGRAEDAAARQEELWQASAGQRTPWALAENDPNVKESVETLRRSVGAMNAAHLATLKGQLTGIQMPGAEASGGGMLLDPAYQAMSRQISQMAEQIAIGIVDQYEANHARQQGGPAWARPEDRLGAIEKLKKKYMGALVNGGGGAPTGGAPMAGGGSDPNAM
jgi:hypothetical protein